MTESLDDHKFIGPYNIGRTEKISIKNLAILIRDLINPKIKFEIEQQLEAKILCQWCNCSRIEKDLGWKAQTSLIEGIKKVI